MKAILTSSMFLSLLATGCMVDRAYDSAQLDPANVVGGGPGSLLGSARDASNGRLTGDVGPARSLDNAADQLRAYDDGYYFSVETVVRTPARAAMTILSINNGSAELRPGLDATFSPDTYADDGMQVNVLACTGQQIGVYDEYDQPADETHLVVTEGKDPSTMDVKVASKWYEHDPFSGERTGASNDATTSFTLQGL